MPSLQDVLLLSPDLRHSRLQVSASDIEQNGFKIEEERSEIE